MRRPDVVLLAVYPPKAAATRLRLGLAQASLQRLPVVSSMWTFLSDRALDTWIAGGLGRLVTLPGGFFRLPRLWWLATRSHMIIVQREVLPFNTVIVESWAKRRDVRLIWDVDDAIWLANTGVAARIRGSSRKYRWMTKNADEVWAGNNTVAAWCVSHGAQNVIVVPTLAPPAVDYDESLREDDLLIWIGTPSTAPFLDALLDVLASSLRGWRVLVVGGTVSERPGLPIEQLPWTPENEQSALSRGSIGLYPVDQDHPLASGKSGLKCILFMSYGVPVIATDTSSNRDVMPPEAGGFLVKTPDEWVAALAALSHEEDRRAHGERGRRFARQRYDVVSWAGMLAARVDNLLASSDARDSNSVGT